MRKWNNRQRIVHKKSALHCTAMHYSVLYSCVVYLSCGWCLCESVQSLSKKSFNWILKVSSNLLIIDWKEGWPVSCLMYCSCAALPSNDPEWGRECGREWGEEGYFFSLYSTHLFHVMLFCIIGFCLISFHSNSFHSTVSIFIIPFYFHLYIFLSTKLLTLRSILLGRSSHGGGDSGDNWG